MKRQTTITTETSLANRIRSKIEFKKLVRGRNRLNWQGPLLTDATPHEIAAANLRIQAAWSARGLRVGRRCPVDLLPLPKASEWLVEIEFEFGE
jgi:hypothetical protein